jgi:hypothetical protein
MPLLTVTYYSLVILVFSLICGAILVSVRLVWPAAIISHLVNFLGGFSIGLYTLIVTFVLVAIGIAHGSGWLKKPIHGVTATVLAIAFWAVAIRMIDDFWLFLPFSLLGWLL